MQHYTPPKPAPLPEDYEAFYATLTNAEKELDALAKEKLGSSYVIQWTHMYLKWKKAAAAAAANASGSATAAPLPATGSATAAPLPEEEKKSCP